MGTRQTCNIFKLLTAGKTLVVLPGLEGLQAAALLAQSWPLSTDPQP